jgi:hypothetical protein
VAVVLELVLVNGERRGVSLPGHTDSIANALNRLDPWIKTDDGGWVQKKFIVEVRAVRADPVEQTGSAEEYERLTQAAEMLADDVDS